MLRREPALPISALVVAAVVAAGCCVRCTLVAAHFSGFPALVFGGCVCVPALAAVTALVGRAHATAGAPGRRWWTR
jgi:hypothetical protein